MRSSRAKRGICTLLVAAAPLSAQTQPDRPLFTRNDAYLLGAFAAGTMALLPVDRHLTHVLRDSVRINNPGLVRASRVFGFLGSPGTFIAIGALYGAGKALDEPSLERAGVRGAEGMLTGLVVAGVLKGTFGRARPFVTADTNPRDFKLLRGFTSDRFQAFPSGHTTTAFAFAAAITADAYSTDRDLGWIVGPLLYTGAAVTGLSRMYEDKHWASDVVVGAAIGTFAGIKVVRFARTTAGARLDRRLLGSDAMRLGYTLRW